MNLTDQDLIDNLDNVQVIELILNNSKVFNYNKKLLIDMIVKKRDINLIKYLLYKTKLKTILVFNSILQNGDFKFIIVLLKYLSNEQKENLINDVEKFIYYINYQSPPFLTINRNYAYLITREFFEAKSHQEAELIFLKTRHIPLHRFKSRSILNYRKAKSADSASNKNKVIFTQL